MPDAAAKTLTMDVEHKGSTTIVHCHGQIVAGVGDQLYTDVHALLPQAKCIVIDMADVKRVDSLGLGTLVRIYVSARSAGTSVELTHLGKQIRELLGLTGLIDVFGGMCENGITMMKF